MKQCRVCGEMKPLNEYYKKAANRDGHSNICKPCKLAYDREHKAKEETIEPDNSPPPMHPLNRLAQDIIIHAIRESRRKGAMETRKWLLSRECALYCDALEIRFEIIENFVQLGCPPASKMDELRNELFRGV